VIARHAVLRRGNFVRAYARLGTSFALLAAAFPGAPIISGLLTSSGEFWLQDALGERALTRH